MMKWFRCSAVLVLVLVSLVATSVPAEERRCQNVVLVTLDGLRWQELFGGAEQRLIDRQAGGVREPEVTLKRFAAPTAQQRRQKLMPFFWDVVATRGQVLGDPQKKCDVVVTNGLFFSYPGYNEILSGVADPKINSNKKLPNPNVTVLEWLNRKAAFRGRIAAFTSWDVFPFIINSQRSGIYVNAGWQPLQKFRDPDEQRHLKQMAQELPRYWHNVRYDTFTFRGAMEYLDAKQPRVLYLALGETDDWAHAGRYDLYLDAARRSDDFLRRLWEAIEKNPHYAGKTALVVTTDHGRGTGREGWKSHGAKLPGCDRIWIAVMGPDTQPLGVISNRKATQSQVAATVASLLGEDFTTSSAKVAKPLTGVTR